MFFFEGVMILVGVDVDANCLKIMIDFNDSLKTIVLYRICADIYLVDTVIVYIQQSHIVFTQKILAKVSRCVLNIAV